MSEDPSRLSAMNTGAHESEHISNRVGSSFGELEDEAMVDNADRYMARHWSSLKESTERPSRLRRQMQPHLGARSSIITASIRRKFRVDPQAMQQARTEGKLL